MLTYTLVIHTIHTHTHFICTFPFQSYLFLVLLLLLLLTSILTRRFWLMYYLYGTLTRTLDAARFIHKISYATFLTTMFRIIFYSNLFDALFLGIFTSFESNVRRKGTNMC